MADSAATVPDLTEETCLLCRQSENDVLLYGHKYCSTYKKERIVVHYFCLLYSCGLVRASEDDKFGIQGFAEVDIIKERNRGKKWKCRFCKKNGATLGCCIGDHCRVVYHLPCGRKNGVRFEAYENFNSFCAKHSDTSSIHVSEGIHDSKVCPVCDDEIDVSDKKTLAAVQCRCCHHIYHWTCISKFAATSGMFHFKCPSCNCNNLKKVGLTKEQRRTARRCKRRFVREAQKRGVFIPVKDADWELDGSFEEHDREYDECDIRDEDGNFTCVCDKGRNYDEPEHKRNKWYIALCTVCGGHGCHRKCRNIRAVDCANWVCDICTEVIDKSAAAVFVAPVAPAAVNCIKEEEEPTVSISDSNGEGRCTQATAVVNPLPRPSAYTSTPAFPCTASPIGRIDMIAKKRSQNPDKEDACAMTASTPVGLKRVKHEVIDLSSDSE